MYDVVSIALYYCMMYYFLLGRVAEGEFSGWSLHHRPTDRPRQNSTLIYYYHHHIGIVI